MYDLNYLAKKLSHVIFARPKRMLFICGGRP